MAATLTGEAMSGLNPGKHAPFNLGDAKYGETRRLYFGSQRLEPAATPSPLRRAGTGRRHWRWQLGFFGGRCHRAIGHPHAASQPHNRVNADRPGSADRVGAVPGPPVGNPRLLPSQPTAWKEVSHLKPWLSISSHHISTIVDLCRLPSGANELE